MTKSFTYRVASNPAYMDNAGLHVLFSGESQTRSSHRVGPKVVDYYLLHHVLSGKGQFTNDQTTEELRAGHSFLIAPRQLVRYTADEQDPWRYRWIAFTGEQANRLLAETGLSPESPIADTGRSRIPGERSRAIYEAFKARRRSASLEAAGELHLLLAALADARSGDRPAPLRPQTHAEELVRHVISHLSTQYAEPVTIEAMSEALGYNRAYLSRLFKREVGVTPIAFLTRVRLDQGKRLLRERPELTIEQIASSVGFPDALYFSKQFRRAYDESPTSYRSSVLDD